MRVGIPPAPPPHAPGADDGRDAGGFSAEDNAGLCAGCSTCCSYITVEVDKPRTPREYDQWLWAIMHRHISLYVERPERWFLCIETPCESLDAGGRCGIYGRHPVLCREHDPRWCERRLPLADIRAWFRGAPELEAWIRRERPKHWDALMAWRKDTVPGPPIAVGMAGRRAAKTEALVQSGELVSAGGGSNGRRRTRRD